MDIGESQGVDPEILDSIRLYSLSPGRFIQDKRQKLKLPRKRKKKIRKKQEKNKKKKRKKKELEGNDIFTLRVFKGCERK